MKRLLIYLLLFCAPLLVAQEIVESHEMGDEAARGKINRNFDTAFIDVAALQAEVAINTTQLQDSLFHSRISTASDSIDIADKGGKIYMNVAGANNLTVVANSIKALPIEAEITVINWGAGKTTIVAGAGVTINSAAAALDLRVQYSAATLIKQATDIWILVGDID